MGGWQEKILGQNKSDVIEALDCSRLCAGGAAHQYFRWQLDLQCTAGEPAGRGWCSNQQENTGRLRPVPYPERMNDATGRTCCRPVRLV